jgi:hypothetical protein
MTLDLKSTDDKRTLTGRGTPVDAARVVAVAIRIERLKLRADPMLASSLLVVQQSQFRANIFL